MNDRQDLPDPILPDEYSKIDGPSDQKLSSSAGAELGFAREPAYAAPPSTTGHDDLTLRRRGFRRNLFLLLSLSLAAFILTSWILVRVDSRFGMLLTGPQDIARAQLRALDRGELRPAYDMFSESYRKQVPFDVWHELVVTHWRMFHSEILRASAPAQSGSRATLEMHLRGADEKVYRARFTLIRVEGRWWIDDVHWTEEANGHDFTRT